jgi:hypothetical protein
MDPIASFDREPKPPAGVGQPDRGGVNWRVVIGVLIVGYGLILTAGNLGWGFLRHTLVHWYWPVALTSVGLLRVWSARSGVGRAVGGCLAFIGGWWLVSEVYGEPFNLFDWWPIAIVAFGILLIARAWEHGGDKPLSAAPAARSASPAEPGSAAAKVSAFAVWSGVHRRVASAFKRADLAAVMGGIEIDLRPAVTVGGEAVIDVLVIWGGIEITVPPDWAVSNEAVVIMGGIEDKSSGGQGAQHTLVVRGLVLMGGVEIKT